MTFLGVGQNIETSGPKSFWKARKEMKEKTSFEPLFETFLRRRRRSNSISKERHVWISQLEYVIHRFVDYYFPYVLSNVVKQGTVVLYCFYGEK